MTGQAGSVFSAASPDAAVAAFRVDRRFGAASVGFALSSPGVASAVADAFVVDFRVVRVRVALAGVAAPAAEPSAT
jgi:hypothetical protein